MKTEAKQRSTGLGVTIAITLSIAIMIIGAIIFSDPSAEEQEQQAQLEEIKPVKRYLEIRHDCYSVVVEPTKALRRFTWGAIGDDVPFQVVINGGKEAGGIEYNVPPWKNWERLKWVAPEFPNTILEVKFKYLRTGSAQVWCKIEPL